MASGNDEDERLRSVAWQNAQAILQARQRAEEELVRAKEALEQKAAELAESLATLRATLESTTDGVLVTDRDRRIAFHNEHFARLWRIPREALDSRDHNIVLELASRQIRDTRKFLDRVHEIYESSPADTYDVLQFADGRVIERFSRTQIVGEQRAGRVWSFRDITERRRSQEALQKQTEWLQVTLNSIGDAVITTDEACRILTLNPIAESLTRWSQLEAAGKPLDEVFRIINEHTRLPVENPAQKALQEGRIVGLANHTILVAKDGTELAIDDSAAPIRDANRRVIGAVLTFRDITKRRRDEARLKQSEEELSDFFENASLGLHWVGPDGTILRANRAELNLLGYQQDEYVGHHIAEFHADEAVIREILRRLSAGESLCDCEARMRCKDGTIKHVLIDSNVLWQDGRFVHTRCFTRDITLQKRAEDALRASESQLRMIMDHAPVFIARCDRENHYRFVNRSYAQRFGLTPEDIVGRHISEVLGPDAWRAIQPYVERVLAGEKVEYELEVPYRNIGPRFMHCVYEPERDSSGVHGWVSVVNDVTERRSAEEAKARLAAIVDTSEDAIISKTLDGRIVSWNTAAEQLFGYSAEEAVGQFITLIIPPELRDEETTILDRLQRGERVEHFETIRQTKAGARINISLTISPVRNERGRIIGASKIARDITQRIRGEQTARFLVEASAALAEITDYESTLQRVARHAVPFFADWCAVDMQEADGSVRRLAITAIDTNKLKTLREVEEKYPSLTSEPRGIRNVLRTGKPEFVPHITDQMLLELGRNDEHLRILRDLALKSYICVPLLSRDRTIGTLTFATAESRREYNVNDLRAAEDLSHRAAIAIENATLLATLRDADQRKDEFLAMLAHELRNPLAPIRNAVEILRAQGPPLPELQWARDVIDRQVLQMSRLVDDLLDVSRISRGLIDLRPEQVELATVLNNAIESSRPLIEKWGHELSVSIPSEPIYLNADVTRLTQVFLNLMNNAAKYMEHGGRIWLSADRENDQAVVKVKDAGVGIPPSMLGHVFEMFAQVERSRERSEGGLGIGLTLVRRLVQLHGGSVEAKSDGLGKGSEFVVRLPVAVQRTKAEQIRSESEAPRAVAKRRILVVDDNRDAADSLGRLLSILGNEVLTAHDGMEAVGAAASFHPDVILLDIGLPKLNGYEAAQQIRQQQDGAGIVLIALTGWGQEEDRRQSKEAGFDHHLTKPVDLTTLRALLADI